MLNTVAINFQEFLPQLEDAGGTKGNNLNSVFFYFLSHES